MPVDFMTDYNIVAVQPAVVPLPPPPIPAPPESLKGFFIKWGVVAVSGCMCAGIGSFIGAIALPASATTVQFCATVGGAGVCGASIGVASTSCAVGVEECIRGGESCC